MKQERISSCSKMVARGLAVVLMAACMTFTGCGKSSKSGKSEALKNAEASLKKDLDATPEELIAASWIYAKVEDSVITSYIVAYKMQSDSEKVDTLETFQDLIMDEVSAKELSKLVEKGKKKAATLEEGVSERVSVLNNLLKEAGSKDFVVKAGDFYIQKTEVTQGLYQAVGKSNPSIFSGNDSRPVENVSWYEAIMFCNLLSERHGLKPCYSLNGITDANKWGTSGKDYQDYDIDLDEKANGWRLPTEEEWNLAADDGHTYSGGDDINEVAWYEENSEDHPQKVASKAANTKGIFDMSGNVWEWCWDKDEESSDERVFLGGCWASEEEDCTVTSQESAYPKASGKNVGFRMVRNVK